ncbi:MAG: hypothetical protein ACXWT1_17510 [Methylobacter sp.]
MSIDRTARLKNLHLYGMAAAWSEWQAEYALQQKPVMSISVENLPVLQ